MTISILGLGNVAHHLVRAMIQNTIQVKQIYNRSLDKAAELGEANHIEYTDDIKKLQRADVFIIATADDAIEELSQQIPFPDAIVAHTSGTSSIERLKGNFKKGVIYPLQTFSKDRYVKYDEIPFFIEAENPEILKALKNLAKKITHRVYELNSEKRKEIHLAAVFVCNFVNYLYGIGKDLVEKEGLPFSVLQALILETAEKIKELNPYEAQTGPAVRGDEKTIAQHLELLNDMPRKKAIYELLTKSIQEKYT